MNMKVSPGCESKVTHSVSPLGPQRVSCKRRGTLPSGASPAQMTGENTEETQPCVVDYTYIHSQTQVIYSLSRQPLVSPAYFFADLHAEGLTEVSTQSPDAKMQRIGSPLG